MVWGFHRAAEAGLPQPAGLGTVVLGWGQGGGWELASLRPRTPGHLLTMSGAPEHGQLLLERGRVVGSRAGGRRHSPNKGLEGTAGAGLGLGKVDRRRAASRRSD